MNLVAKYHSTVP